MLDGSHLPTLQRSRGRASASFAHLRGAVRLVDLHQSGSARIMLPRTAGPVPEAVFLNTSGGLTDGDTLSFGLHIGEGARVLATTQTSERAYAARRDAAQVSVTATVLAGGRLDWLPQETILYDRSALTRRTVVDMAADARLLMLEMLVLGRAAMGERVQSLDLFDRREVRRGGRVTLVDPLRLTADNLTGQSVILGDHSAMASLVLVAGDAALRLEAVRHSLARVAGVEAGASAWDGKLTVRILAPSGFALRRAVLAALGPLRQGPLPRVWQI